MSMNPSQKPMETIVKKLISLFVLGKMYSNYKVSVYHKFIYGNPLANIIRQTISSLYKDFISISSRSNIFSNLFGGGTNKVVKGTAMVSLNIVIFIIVMIKLLKEVITKLTMKINNK
jgi:hypothetical protein